MADSDIDRLIEESRASTEALLAKLRAADILDRAAIDQMLESEREGLDSLLADVASQDKPGAPPVIQVINR
jgi:hypothetical protein